MGTKQKIKSTLTIRELIIHSFGWDKELIVCAVAFQDCGVCVCVCEVKVLRVLQPNVQQKLLVMLLALHLQ